MNHIIVYDMPYALSSSCIVTVKECANRVRTYILYHMRLLLSLLLLLFAAFAWPILWFYRTWRANRRNCESNNEQKMNEKNVFFFHFFHFSLYGFSIVFFVPKTSKFFSRRSYKLICTFCLLFTAHSHTNRHIVAVSSSLISSNSKETESERKIVFFFWRTFFALVFHGNYHTIELVTFD